MSTPVSFGPFEFDPDNASLMRAGMAVRLQPQPARVLALLVRRAGQVVTREELRQEVWGDGTTVDFERGLNFCVAQVRAALGDDADSPRFVETIPRRGYRFIAPVQQAGGALPERGKRRTRGTVAVALALGVVLVAVVGWRLGVSDGRTRVAVVPFDNETGDDDLDAVARGIADATVARLAAPERVERVRVIGNAAALERPRSFRDLKRIGADLNVDYILLAQMKRDDSGVRLIAHLIRTSDESHEWARSYDRPDFTLAAQAEIAESIAAETVRCLTEGCARPPDPSP
jgi:DNA-binding winged helix-turn-helix (wHTH) protein/TolB-like protein